MIDRRAVEELALVRGGELLARMAERRRLARDEHAHGNPLVHWRGEDEAFLASLGRLVARLPTLSDAEVTERLRESFPDRNRLFPPALRDDRPVPEALRLLMEGLLDRFTAGRSMGDALRAAHDLHRRGLEATLDVLGEAVSTEELAREHREAYLELLSRASVWPHRPNVSIKFSSLCARLRGDDLDDGRRRVAPHFRALLAEAKRRGGFVNVDMERRHHLAMSHAVFREVLAEDAFRDTGDVSLVVQCYLVDAPERLRSLRDWARKRERSIRVRLVKGAYWAQEKRLAANRGEACPVHEGRHRTDACHENAVLFAAENGEWLRPLVASHNPRSVAWAMAAVELAGRPRSFIEFQGLRGFGEDLRAAVVAMGWPVREYTPFGPPAAASAYLTRRIQEALAPGSVLPRTWGTELDAEELLTSPHRPDEEDRP